MRRVKDTREPRYSHCVRDGCGKPRRRPKGKWAVDAWLVDAFCSTECAKAHNGVEFRRSSEFIEDEREFDRALAEARA